MNEDAAAAVRTEWAVRYVSDGEIYTVANRAEAINLAAGISSEPVEIVSRTITVAPWVAATALSAATSLESE